MTETITLELIKKDIKKSPLEMIVSNTTRLFSHYIGNNYRLREDIVEKINFDLKFILKELLKKILTEFGNYPHLVRYCLSKLYLINDQSIEFTKKEFYRDVINLIYFYSGTTFGKKIDAEVGITLKKREEEDDIKFTIIKEKMMAKLKKKRIRVKY